MSLRVRTWLRPPYSIADLLPSLPLPQQQPSQVEEQCHRRPPIQRQLRAWRVRLLHVFFGASVLDKVQTSSVEAVVQSAVWKSPESPACLLADSGWPHCQEAAAPLNGNARRNHVPPFGFAREWRGKGLPIRAGNDSCTRSELHCSS